MSGRRRRVESAEVRFGPALKALVACLLIGGAAVAYVRQQHEVFRLRTQAASLLVHIKALEMHNQRVRSQLHAMRGQLLTGGDLAAEVRRRLPDMAPARAGQVLTLPLWGGGEEPGVRRYAVVEGGRP